MKVTITLHGACAERMLFETARQYAVLCVKSKTPPGVRNGPWLRSAGGPKTHAQWVQGVDRDRVAYRKSLQSVLEELPDVPQPELKPGLTETGKKHDGLYSVGSVEAIARAWAEEFLRLLKTAP